MKVPSSRFVTSAVKAVQYPDDMLPEIAFAGRSNAGKSSMINVLLNRKRLVKTSSTPGKTQLINFFLINDAFMFVDLPGYGYARVPEAVKQKWGAMVETYLEKRANLRGFVLLMDVRRLPSKEEMDLLGWMRHYRLRFVLVLTKADKLSKSRQKDQQRRISLELGVDTDGLILFSAKSRLGGDRIWEALDFFLDPSIGWKG